MNKDVIKNLVLVLLSVLTVFSLVRYAGELKTRFQLQDSLAKAQDKITVLTQEKRNLLQDLGKEKKLSQQLAIKSQGLKAYLKASKDRLKRFFNDSLEVQRKLEDMNAKFTLLKAENKALTSVHKHIYAENERFKFKLGSVEELKKAIKELVSGKPKDLDAGTPGNQGFLIKDGRLTSGKIKIEVNPVKNKE